MNSAGQPSYLHVELTGPLRRAAGTDRLTFPANDVTTLLQLILQIRQSLPQTQSFLPLEIDESGNCRTVPPGLLVARGSQMLPQDPLFPLTPGDHLTLIPMISGG